MDQPLDYTAPRYVKPERFVDAARQFPSLYEVGPARVRGGGVAPRHSLVSLPAKLLVVSIWTACIVYAVLCFVGAA